MAIKRSGRSGDGDLQEARAIDRDDVPVAHAVVEVDLERVDAVDPLAVGDRRLFERQRDVSGSAFPVVTTDADQVGLTGCRGKRDLGLQSARVVVTGHRRCGARTRAPGVDGDLRVEIARASTHRCCAGGTGCVRVPDVGTDLIVACLAAITGLGRSVGRGAHRREGRDALAESSGAGTVIERGVAIDREGSSARSSDCTADPDQEGLTGESRERHASARAAVVVGARNCRFECGASRAVVDRQSIVEGAHADSGRDEAVARGRIAEPDVRLDLRVREAASGLGGAVGVGVARVERRVAFGHGDGVDALVVVGDAGDRESAGAACTGDAADADQVLVAADAVEYQ